MSNDIKDLFKATAYDNAGDKLGSVKEIFVDDNSGQPTFVEVNHGLFGMNSSLVPMRGHKFDGENLNLAFAKDRVKDAPDFDADQALTPEQQNEIYRHYGLDNVEDTTRYGEGAGNQDAGAQDAGKERSTLDRHETAGGNTAAGAGVGAAGAGVAGANADQAGATEREAANTDAANREAAVNNEGEIIRSEERLNVQKDKVQTGEARLRKYVVTDTETVEVPVTREEVRVERTPISEEEAANLKGNIDEAGQEASVTLNEERVSVNKETVPVEKVSLNKEQITETERHTEELRKEQIDSDLDGDVRK